MERLEAALYALAEEHQPLTIRQLFYRAVAGGIIDKTQSEYANVVVRLAGKMREEGTLPFEWIVDNTRWMRKPTTHASLDSMLKNTADFYRRDLWRNQDAYVEIWCESDSISGVLGPVTTKFDVPLMPCGGQPSKSFVYSCAEGIGCEAKPSFVYYFGDYDKSGLDISDRIERDIRRYLSDDSDFHFSRVAINEDQIADYNLPTRPPKKSKAKKNAVEQTVELEAMTTKDLQDICRGCIEQHIDQTMLAHTLAIEASERDTLQMILDNLEGER